MKLSKEKLHQLIKDKIHLAGLNEEHADILADILVFADMRGIHSHGAVRVEYYCERILKGGINKSPNFSYKETGPCSGIYEGDNGSGHVVAKRAMEEAIKMANFNGISVIGMRNISHSGALGYFTTMAAKEGLIALSVCQSDPMVVPFGGSEVYYGTNPIAFSAPASEGRVIDIDMATSIQAWGKILDARSRNQEIPSNWAVDEHGNSTTDPNKVNALLPIAGPKGYCLMMMVDVLSGILLGLPFGKHVSSMYHDLSKGRSLGQLHIVINPDYFTSKELVINAISQTIKELGDISPVEGFNRVYYPGEDKEIKAKESEVNGINIVDEIYEYLISDKLYINSYDNKSAFN